MTRSDAESGRGLAHLRHELRTPAGHVIGYAEMLEELHADLLDAEEIAALRAIQASGRRLAALVTELLGGAVADEEHVARARDSMSGELEKVRSGLAVLVTGAASGDRSDVLADLDRIDAACAAFASILAKVPAVPPGGSADHPAPPAPDTSAPPRDAVIPMGGGEGTILIVDDDRTNRDLLCRRLALEGYDAIAASGGAAALRRLERSPVDLVLLDLIMPAMDGLETLARIKGNARFAATPVLMLSAADDVSRVVRAINAGAEDFIPKPFNPVLLSARIGAVLEKYRLRRQLARRIKIFISSPGDVIPERQAVKAVIGRLNDEFEGEALLVPVMWEEEPLLASDTFQTQIQQPDEADIYIGIFWSRIGSPLPEAIVRPDGSRYESGTAYEFERAVAGNRDRGAPDLLVYRKAGAPSVTLDDREAVLEGLDQVSALQEYLDRWFRGSDGTFQRAFHTFETVADLEVTVETHLRKLVRARMGPPSAHVAG